MSRDKRTHIHDLPNNVINVISNKLNTTAAQRLRATSKQMRDNIDKNILPFDALNAALQSIPTLSVNRPTNYIFGPKDSWYFNIEYNETHKTISEVAITHNKGVSFATQSFDCDFSLLGSELILGRHMVTGEYVVNVFATFIAWLERRLKISFTNKPKFFKELAMQLKEDYNVSVDTKTKLHSYLENPDVLHFLETHTLKQVGATANHIGDIMLECESTEDECFVVVNNEELNIQFLPSHNSIQVTPSKVDIHGFSVSDAKKAIRMVMKRINELAKNNRISPSMQNPKFKDKIQEYLGSSSGGKPKRR